MTFPIPPAPITWTKNKTIRAPQLRADAANLAWVYTKRPLFFATQVTTSQIIANNSLTAVNLDTTFVDTFLGHQSATSTNYACNFSGWYLVQGAVTYTNAQVQTGNYAAGIHVVQNGTASNLLGSYTVPYLSSVAVTSPTCDLVQMIAGGDVVAMNAFQTQGSSVGLTPANFLKAEWVALPTTSYAGVSTALGTVVSQPLAPALWPPGVGTTLTSSIAAGATSINVVSTQGMIINGTLGLEYFQGNAVSSTAEVVNITSVSGPTVSISATTYAHAQNAYVSIPVSAAFLNSQVRDTVNFLAYPPIARLHNFGGSQSLPAQVFPAATAVNMQAATVDNFAGWGGVGTATYTFPLSGVYFVYGQVAVNAVVTSTHAGLSVAGTIQWGDSIRTGGTTALSTCATVSKLVRVTAAQSVNLVACVSTAAGLTTSNAGFYSTLIVVWRGF